MRPRFKARPTIFRHGASGFALPVLRKDFLFDPYQVLEARAWGADCILIILAAVDDEARALNDTAQTSAWMCWWKCMTRTNSTARCRLEARLIGVNNRDLRTFHTSLDVCERLSRLIPKDRVVVGESGISRHADCVRLASRRDRGVSRRRTLDAQRRVAAATRALLTGIEPQGAKAAN